MLVIFLGAMTAAIKPSSWPLALAGYALSFLGAVRGFGYSYALEGIVAQASYSEFYLAPCRPGGTEFPFGLPLDRWSPAHFLPRGLCGDVSSSWDFLGLSMSAWLMVIYLAYLSGLALMLAARLRFRLAR
jgi:disulfide bond formation protein DsbB